MTKKEDIIVFQAKSGAIELREDLREETVWASLGQISDIFGRDKSVISRHISNIFKEGELEKNQVVAKNATTAKDGKVYQVAYYNLDAIISIGYRVNSKTATRFRQWATQTLKSHITQGYTINPSRIEQNYDAFLTAVEDVKKLLPEGKEMPTGDILELVKSFASTWFSLQSYDEDGLPDGGVTKSDVAIQASDLYEDIEVFKTELMEKGEATQMFAEEKKSKNLEGIVGNVFQSAFGEDVYSTVEEKAAHLLYFVIKNHPFTDGNKRTGAFTFIWFLHRMGVRFESIITPQALTAITLLIAESDPKDKDRMVGLVLLLLQK